MFVFEIWQLSLDSYGAKGDENVVFNGLFRQHKIFTERNYFCCQLGKNQSKMSTNRANWVAGN